MTARNYRRTLQQQHREEFEIDLFFSTDDVLEFDMSISVQLATSEVILNVIQDQFQALAITIQETKVNSNKSN